LETFIIVIWLFFDGLAVFDFFFFYFLIYDLLSLL